MKNLKTYSMLFILSFTTLVSCSKDDDSQSNNTAQTSAEQVAQIAENGNWRITSFIDSGDDETNDFSGYTFQFNRGGSLSASNGTTTLTGSWSVMDDSGSSSSDDDDDFNIFFPVPETNAFEDLNDDWDIISVSNNRIELIDISGGNGGTDYLTFEKN